eukprot:TRINITY_DN30481_c0_g1_i1.p1 TRINITY_DN30481_c0_g1~~TRINITY_DN30481_c0_g1_i1.p1  ORF type:complete len:640 (+),score=141.27 TRINITY_DN30481_c0_g1_i1:79-1998(+)
MLRSLVGSEMCIRDRYRIVLPLSSEEYRRGMLFAVAKQSSLETTAGDGIEFLENKEYVDADGQQGIYTKKIVRLGEKLPKWTSMVMPASALTLEEECWNTYPRVRTVYHCAFFEKRFQMTVETMHLEDDGCTENALVLEPKELEQRVVEWIDITKPPNGEDGDSVPVDFSVWHSEKAGRGPLAASWATTSAPVMCCYKLVRVNFSFFGFQSKVEKVIHQRGMCDVFHRMHRLLLATLDEWFDMSLKEIQGYEDEVARKLDEVKAAVAANRSPRSTRSRSSTPGASPMGAGASPMGAIAEAGPCIPGPLLASKNKEPAPPLSPCRHCTDELAVMSCSECQAEYCDDCHRVLHFNRKRKGHKFKALPVTQETLTAYAFLGNSEGVVKALNMGVYIDAQDSLGRSALHLAVASGSVECTQALLSASADMNVQDSLGRTPLHVAIACSNLEAVYLLVHRGCDLVLKDKEGLTVYDLCMLYGESEAKGAITAGGMTRKYTNDLVDRERSARQQREATDRSLQRLQQELKHVRDCNPRAELDEMVHEMQALWHTLLNVSKINKLNSESSAEEAVQETQKNIQLYTAAVEHLTAMYAGNPATNQVWEPLRKILADGGRMKHRLLGFASTWCETTGRSVEDFDQYND